MNCILFFTLVFIGTVCFTVPAWSQENDEFVLVKKDGSICLYERWLTYPLSDPPIKTREVKCVFFYNNTIAEGLRLLRDEKRAELWKSNIEEFRIYSSRDTSTWHEYSYHDIPWPVSDQDHFIEYKVAGNKGKLVSISFESKVNNTLAPVREGVNRVHLSGSWTMEQISPGKVKVTYKVLSKPAGIPKAFADPFIRSNFMTTFQDFIALMEQSK